MINKAKIQCMLTLKQLEHHNEKKKYRPYDNKKKWRPRRS